jgi:sugar diacid utilization regulator
MVAGHANEQSRKPRTEAQERMWLVDRLIHGLFNSTEEMRSDARTLGCDLSPPYGLCLVVPGSETGLDGLRSLSTSLADCLPRAIEGPSRPMPSGLHSVMLLSRVSDTSRVLARDLDEAARAASVHVLCPEPTETLESLQGVYRRTNRDIRLPAHVRLPTGIVTADDLALCRLVTRASPEETADFVDRFIGPVRNTKAAAQLIETLEVLYRSRGVPEAAASLVKHDNTVYSRIRRVTELTGCDLDIPEEAQRVYLALQLRSVVDPDALEGFGD